MINDKPERYYTLQIEKLSTTYGAFALNFKDSGHRKLNPTPFDNIFYSKLTKGMIFIEAKIGKEKLSEKQIEFAILCALEKINYCVLRIFKRKFVIAKIDEYGTEKEFHVINSCSIDDVIIWLRRNI